MDVGKGWPHGEAHDKTIINRIMLRFRPIAPKPVADGSVSDSVSPARKTAPITKRRAKRKYARVKKNRKCSKITNKQEEIIRKDLQFDLVNLGGTKVFSDIGSSKNNISTMKFELLEKQPALMNIFDNNNGILNTGLADRAVSTSAVRLVESWVVVDGMAETLPEIGGLGSTDGEKMRNLEMDTCPGLISDDMYRVQWVNLAYKRMVMDPYGSGEGDGGEPPAEVVVWMVLKENIPVVVWPMFACTVRVVYTWRKERYSRTMPCDVWKMDFGGFAWRLDAKAALCLGR
ncbi:hypothetical protein ACH5RR_014529 [Cinchona calisaya]|uniref:DUF7950 domain-containing protein n=1 Tax=Cinchona calisaya TaxID=153742 RepID=A0ABD3A6R4_9GENT